MADHLTLRCEVVVKVMTEDLAGDHRSLLKGHRAGATYRNHILVDEGLAAELDGINATGMSFRGVYAVMPDKRQVKLRFSTGCRSGWRTGRPTRLIQLRASAHAVIPEHGWRAARLRL